MLWVVPIIAGNQEQYAIYMICVSLCLFLTYCDFGFLGASQKYASEAIGKGDYDAELSYIGFSIALLGCFCLLFCIGMIMLSLNPTLVIHDLSQEETIFASSMLFIIAIMMPVQVIFQRALYLIVSVRLLEYLVIRIDVIFNGLKIIIIPVFFDDEVFLLLEYFISSISLSILSCVVGFVAAKRKTHFSLKALLKAIRFDRVTFDRMKYLAGSSSLATLFFILYYELDLLIAAKLFSIESTAYYALAFAFYNFVRALSGVIYSPFTPLMNLSYGMNGNNGAKDVAYKLLEITLPLFIFLAVFLFIYAQEIVTLWVGSDYAGSADLIGILAIGLALSSFSHVAGIYFVTMQRHRDLIFSSAIRLISFVFFLVILFKESGVSSLAYAKTYGSIIGSVYCAIIFFRARVVDASLLWRTVLFVIVGGLLAIYFPSGIGFDGVASVKNTSLLFFVILIAGAMIILTTSVALFMFSTSRLVVFDIYRQLRSGISVSKKLS